MNSAGDFSLSSSSEMPESVTGTITSEIEEWDDRSGNGSWYRVRKQQVQQSLREKQNHR